MALDGFVISNIVYELNQTILNAKISKIAQPENDELLFTCKGSNGQFRLAMSASASLPFLYLTGQNKPSPMLAQYHAEVWRSHRAWFILTGTAQAYCQWQDRKDLPAAYGAYHSL